MATSRSDGRLFLGRLAGWLALWAAVANGQSKNSCLDCHSNLPEPLGVSQERFSQDIHAQRGLTCASCHGGDPTSDDPDKAMRRKAGWKGKIDRKQIPQLCGSCHSDVFIAAKNYVDMFTKDDLADIAPAAEE